MWIRHHSLLHTKLNEDYLKSFSESTLPNEALQIAKSNFSEYSVFPWSGYESDCLTVFVAKVDSQLRIMHNAVKETVLVKQFDIVIKDSQDHEESEDLSDFYVFKLDYSRQKQLFGAGEKTFEVTAKIYDEYRIKVRANSDEEAIELANSVALSEWKHPDIEPHLTERRIIRYARWGNLHAEEVK